MKKVVISGMIGNALEWYDYALYGQVAVILGQLYFPDTDPTLSLIKTFAVFAIGFMTRPLGGIVFGWIGDKYGRKVALSLSIILMSFSTACIGAIPTYASIGIWAPLLLIATRVVQGISIGGEFGGAITYLVEHSKSHQRGLIGSSAMFSLVIGFLLGSVVITLISSLMSEADFTTWGWRIPFLVSFVLGFIGFYIRKECEESPIYLEAEKEGHILKKPLTEAFRNYLGPISRGVAVYLMVTLPFYLSTIYFITLNQKIFNIPFGDAMTINTISMIVMASIIPFSGWYSDKVGRKKMIAYTSLLFVFISVPIFAYLPNMSMIEIALMEIIFCFFVGVYLGPVPALLAELFPTSVRYTGLSLSYNIAATFFGGTAPMVSTWLVGKYNGTYAIGIYVSCIAFITLSSIVSYKDRSRQAII